MLTVSVRMIGVPGTKLGEIWATNVPAGLTALPPEAMVPYDPVFEVNVTPGVVVEIVALTPVTLLAAAGGFFSAVLVT